jgi:uncharacterized protein
MCRAAALCAALGAALALAAEPPIPPPQGFVTDRAGILSPEVERRITALLTELQAKTGAEVAVVTVPTTAPLDDFSYALRIAEAWKPGRKGEDTGVVFLVATDDRKMRILVGYGLEGILPDGLVGEIQDRYVVPAFRAGRYGEGIWEGVRALAFRIAEARGVRLGSAPAARGPARPEGVPLPGWAVILLLIVFGIFMLYGATRPRRFRRGRSHFGGFPGWGGGGFGGGGGGFGFGGGRFGGGGAGRGW